MAEVVPSGGKRRQSRVQRLAIVGLVALLHILAIYALLRAFDIDVIPESAKSIVSFDVRNDPPPPPPPEPQPEPEGAAAPPAPKAEPASKAAPPPRQIVQPAPPLPPVSGEGTEARSGAADAGTGTGGGGDGSGTGSGGSGSGSGGGGITQKAVKIAGDIIDARDYPRNGIRDRLGTSVTVYFTVGTDGIPRDCRIARPSGDPEADRITCRLIEQRFRYRPALDAGGNPVPARTGWRQSFFLKT